MIGGFFGKTESHRLVLSVYIKKLLESAEIKTDIDFPKKYPDEDGTFKSQIIGGSLNKFTELANDMKTYFSKELARENLDESIMLAHQENIPAELIPGGASSWIPRILQLPIGKCLSPTALSFKIFDFFKEKQWGFYQKNHFDPLPHFYFHEDEHGLKIITKVATATSTDNIQAFAGAGGYAITEALSDVKSHFNNLQGKSHVQIYLPITQDYTTIGHQTRHFTLLVITIANHQTIATYYDSQPYLKLQFDFSGTIKQNKHEFPEAKFYNFYLNQQASFNATDCGRFVSTYIYLLLIEKLAPNQLRYKKVIDTMSFLWATK